MRSTDDAKAWEEKCLREEEERRAKVVRHCKPTSISTETRAKHHALVEMFKAGDTSVLPALLTAYTGYMRWICVLHGKRNFHAYQDDMMQEARIALLECVETYDSQKGTFAGWLYQAVRHVVQEESRAADMIKIPRNLYAAEVCGYNMSERTSERTREQARVAANVVSIHRSSKKTGKQYVIEINDHTAHVQKIVEKREVARIIDNLIATLHEESGGRRERTMAFMHLGLDDREVFLIRRMFFSEDTPTLETLGKECGDRFGASISKERVRQVLNKAIGKLRERLIRDGLDDLAEAS